MSVPDFRVDDLQHAKDVSRQAGLPAMGLWALAGSYSMSLLTDGWVPDWFVVSWPAGRKHANSLVNAGIWSVSTKDGQAGYQFADWSGQRSAEQILAEREAAKHRMQAIRSGRKQPPRSPEHTPNVPPNTTRTFGRSSENVRDSLTLTQGSSGGVNPPTRAKEEPHPHPPAQSEATDPRCPHHAGLPADKVPPCRGCADARETAEQQTRAAQATIRRQQREAAAQTRLAAIANCQLCNPSGYIGTQLCNHDPAAPERAAKGRELVQVALSRRAPEHTAEPSTQDPP